MDKVAANKIVEAALECERLTSPSVPAEVSGSQAALESGWLGSMTGDNNAFGIKSFDPTEPRRLCQTREFFSDIGKIAFEARGEGRKILAETGRTSERINQKTGKPETLREYILLDWFVSYPTLGAAFAAHSELICTKARYRPAWTGYLVHHDPEILLRDIVKAGYATADPAGYTASAIVIMRQLKPLITAARAAS